MQFIKQSSATHVQIGPVAEENKSVLLLKHEAREATPIDPGSISPIKGCGGMARITLDMGHTDTSGQFTIVAISSGGETAVFRFTILPGNVYDSLIAGADTLESNAVKINGNDPETVIATKMADVLNMSPSQRTQWRKPKQSVMK